MNMHAQAKMSFEEFGRWAEGQQRRFELVRGEVRMLPYVKFAHTQLSAVVNALLFQQVDRKKFRMANSDFAIQTGPHSARFADVAIVPASTAPTAGFTSEPVVVIEILSKSTMHVDFGEKRLEYQALPSLQAYLILAQDEPSAWLWQRGDDGNWPADPQQMEGRDGEIRLAAVSASLPMAELYVDIA